MEMILTKGQFRSFNLVLVFAIAVILAPCAHGAVGSISNGVISSAGTVHSVSGGSLSGTLGQPATIGYAAGTGNLYSGFWYGRIDFGLYSHSPPQHLLQPRLVKSYPNPFNPTTQVVFELPHRSDVDISLYDVRGTLIRNLVGDAFDAGRHSVVWNGRDNGGRMVAAGAYLCRFRSCTFQDTQKLLMLK